MASTSTTIPASGPVSMSALYAALNLPPGTSVSYSDVIELAAKGSNDVVSSSDIRGKSGRAVPTVANMVLATTSNAQTSLAGVYSLRRIDRYDPIVRVMRGIDSNSAQNFYGLANGNKLSTRNGGKGSSLEGWLGSNVGRVLVWYDQSSAQNHLVAPASAEAVAPLIERGADGKYCLRFEGGSETPSSNACLSFSNLVTPATVHVTFKPSAGGLGHTLLAGPGTEWLRLVGSNVPRATADPADDYLAPAGASFLLNGVARTSTDAPATLDAWNTLVAVRSNNGMPFARVGQAAPGAAAAARAPYAFTGCLTELLMYGGALPEAEQQKLYAYNAADNNQVVSVPVPISVGGLGTFPVGTTGTVIDLRQYFREHTGSALTFSIASNPQGTATLNGSMLTVASTLTYGLSYAVGVAATNNSGRTTIANAYFYEVATQAPTLLTGGAVTLTPYNSSFSVDMSGYFVDPAGLTQSFSVTSHTAPIGAVPIINGSTLVLPKTQGGTAAYSVVVRATNSAGAAVDAVFTVSETNTPAPAASPVAAVTTTVVGSNAAHVWWSGSNNFASAEVAYTQHRLFPPVDMMSSEVNATGADNDVNGVYTVSVSSQNYGAGRWGYNMFNDTIWPWQAGSTDPFDATTHTYTGSNSLGGHLGAWIHLQMPVATRLQMYGLALDTTARYPVSWKVIGTNDGGASWTVVDERVDVPSNWPAAGVLRVFVLPDPSTYAYRSYALVFQKAVVGVHMRRLKLFSAWSADTIASHGLPYPTSNAVVRGLLSGPYHTFSVNTKNATGQPSSATGVRAEPVATAAVIKDLAISNVTATSAAIAWATDTVGYAPDVTLSWFGGSSNLRNALSCAPRLDGGVTYTFSVTPFNAEGVAGATLVTAPVSTPVPHNNVDGNVQWATRVAGTQPDSGYSVCATADGALCVAGGHRTSGFTAYNANGTAYTPTLGVLSTTASNDAFVVKYDSSGAVRWNARMGSAGNDFVNTVCGTVDGGVVVTGAYTNTFNVYHAGGVLFGTLGSAGATDCFVVKYNVLGTAVWRARLSGSGTSEQGRGVCAMVDGGVCVVGYYNSLLTAYSSPGTAAFATTLPAPSVAGTDAFVAKYASDGTVQWLTRLSSASANDAPAAVAGTQDGGVCVLGTFAGSSLTAYDVGGTAFGTTLASSGISDVFLAKYSTAGAVQWVARIAGNSTDGTLMGNICRLADGGLVVAGSFQSSSLTAYSAGGAAFGTELPNANYGLKDVFVIKYSNAGAVQWVARVAGTGDEDACGLAPMLDGGVCVTGHYSSAVLTAYSADGSPFGTTLALMGVTDTFVAKFSSAGAVQWLTRVAGTQGEAAGGAACLKDGGLCVSGYYESAPLTAFSVGGAAFAPTLSNAGGSDVYVAKYV